jgi:hypothetical protein
MAPPTFGVANIFNRYIGMDDGNIIKYFVWWNGKKFARFKFPW